MEEELESVLFVGRECMVYKIPPRIGAQGYRAQDWGSLEAFLWKGRIRVIEIGSNTPSKCEIRLEDGNTGELFAKCPYDITGKAVESVLDSSRYFVLRIEDGSKKAFIGLGFLERTDAFDFQVSLQDWTKRQRTTKNEDNDKENNNDASVPPPPSKDFSLKEGETISIKIGGKSSTSKKSTSSNNTGGNSIPLIPPPPGGSSRR